uniref:DUF1534 domain-containing protein n=1 Tax=Ascaris lumbricoides TaxID=6252 RepID=A0A0M3I8V1_ASCLU
MTDFEVRSHSEICRDRRFGQSNALRNYLCRANR